MSRHLKRYAKPRQWPVEKKGTKYLVSAQSGELPLLVALRDLLGVTKTRKEVKKVLYEKKVLINAKAAKDDKKGLSLFDVLTLVPMKKSYKLILGTNGKFAFEEIKEADAGKKVAKIIDKKMLKGKKKQLNLEDGSNYLFEEDCKVNDSVLIDLKAKKISKVLPIKEKANVVVFEGKHTGKEGVIEEIKPERKMVAIKVEGEKEALDVLIKQVIVVE